MKLVQQFNKPISGYWNGGPRSIFHWTIQGNIQEDAKGCYIKVGSYEANHYFHVALGKTDKQTLGYARRQLTAMAKRHGPDITCAFYYIED